jgi:hypothetical protein
LEKTREKFHDSKSARVTFNDIAELYVGDESEHYFQSWKYHSSLHVGDTRLMRPLRSMLTDETSFMSMGSLDRNPTPGLQDLPTQNLVEDENIAIDPNQIDQDPGMIEMDIEAIVEESDSADDDVSFRTGDQRPEWFATLLFAIDFIPTPLRVDWNDQEAMHRDAAHIYGISHHDLFYLHHVRHAPQDLADAGVEALIGHRHGDLTQGSTMQLILLDVEFHAAVPDVQPEVVRRTVRLPRQIGRLALLNCLGLAAYCRETQQSCVLWCDGSIVSAYDVRPIELHHGMYIRIAIPPGTPEVQHIGTRCIVTACHQGVTFHELCDRHALYTMGWYDTIIGPPLAPLRPDEEEISLLQRGAKTPELPQRPWFLIPVRECKIDTIEPGDHAEENVGDITSAYINTLDQEPPGGIVPRPGLDEQPEHIHQLLEQLEEHGGTEMEEEGPVLYVSTWFLNHPHHRRCDNLRTVRLTGNFALWHQQLLKTWRDLLEEGQVVDFYVVFPQPPTTRMQPEHVPHVILVQRTGEGDRAAVITVLDSRIQTGQFQHTATFLPLTAGKAEVAYATDHIDDCYPQVSELQCMVWHGEQQLVGDQRIVTHHGISYLLIIQDVTFMTSNAWENEEDEAVRLMQSSAHTTANSGGPTSSESGLNPSAPIFRPGCPSLYMQTEFVQDVFQLWNHRATTWQDEERSSEFAVWFVDHLRHRLQCHTLRKVRLNAAFEYWEERITRVWHDLFVPTEPYELVLVQPSPIDMDHETAGHILIIQNPHDNLVTNLITAYLHDHMNPEQGPTLQFAGTVHEHVYKEHIIEGIGYAQQCFQEEPTHHCEVWYENHELHKGRPWPGRSGMGLLVHLRPLHQTAPILLQLSITLTGSKVTRERQTHGTVAHTHGPRDEPSTEQAHFPFNATEIISGDGIFALPQYIETDGTPTVESVQQELQHWGHQVLAIDCHPHNKFFCVPECHLETTGDKFHFLFCHQDLTDQQGCFAHSETQDLTESQMMMLLCQMGYARAVIVEVERIHENWKKVSFSHQEPRPEQKHQEPRQRTPWPQRSFHEQVEVRPIINLDQVEQLSAQCILNTGFGISEVKDFFTSATDILCRNFDIEGLPEFIQKAIRPAPEGNIDLSIYDRLLIYTDGSSKPEGKRFPPQRADELGMADTWAFLVLGEKFQIESGAHEVHALGWTAHPVRYDVDGHAFTGATRIGSDQAEKAALTFAGLWRLAQNINTTTVICTDAATAGGQAFGHIGAADPDDAFCLLRSTYQALQCALPPDRLLLHHTRSHAGDPYNEFVDIAAKAEAASSFNHPRQKIDLSSWRSHMLHFWMIFATDYGVPQWKDGGFEVPAPALPQQECQLHTEEHTGANFHRTIDIECGLCLATANVQSLARGPEGHGGKLHYLQMQMKAFHINCMGIQEARTERGLRTANNILAFASGSKGGNLGMELWINLEQPIGWQRKRGHTQQHFLHRSDFCVVHGDERRLLVRCDHTSCSFWLFTTHAPHSGRPLRERQEWWEATTELLQRHCDQDTIFWLMDANAPPGKADGAVVFEPGFSSTASTA